MADLNDNPPYFPHPLYSETVPEDIEISQDILTVKAEDPDSRKFFLSNFYLKNIIVNFRVRITI